jgi:tripartite ATP-independent transporter DctM subunit
VDPLLIGIASLALLLLLLVAGLQVALALVLASSFGLWMVLGAGPALHLLASTFESYGSSYTLSVVPLFIAMGLLTSEAQTASRAYDALVCWAGRIPGALALATIGACTLFGAVTGSSIASAAVFARVSAPEMIRHGYEPRLAYGLVASSGAIGMLIPPSILAIVYAAIAEVPVGSVLLAGIGPGLLLAACLGAAVLLLALLRPAWMPTSQARAGWRERMLALRHLSVPALAAVIVIGGIYSGVFTATEAAAVGNFVFVLIFLAWNRGAGALRRLMHVAIETARLTAVIFVLFCGAQLFARLMVVCGISELLVGAVVGASPSALSLAFWTAALYLVLGCFVDSLSILVVTAPILLPALEASRVDPIWFGIVMILASQVGLITPPLGINLFVVKGIAGEGVSVGDVLRGSLPFLVATLVALGLVIALPAISLFIPAARFGD